MHPRTGRLFLLASLGLSGGVFFTGASVSAAKNLSATTARVPLAITRAAVRVTPRRAVLTGIVLPVGTHTRYYFRYGTGSRLNHRTRVRLVGRRPSLERVAASVTRLRAHRTYRFQLVARGAYGASDGRTMILVTPRRGREHSVRPVHPQPIKKPVPQIVIHVPPPPTPPPTLPTGSQYTSLVWSDEFNTPSGTSPAPASWSADLGAWGSSSGDLETDTGAATNVSTDGQGNLALTALQQSATGPDGQTRSYTSARIESGGLRSFQYGKIEARMEVPVGQGLWPQLWMLGDNMGSTGWPNCGEIDIMEMLDQAPGTVYGTIHGPETGSSSAYTVQGKVTSPTSLAGSFHTYGIVWSPGSITWTLDGTPYSTVSRSALPAADQWVFDAQRFHLVLDLAVGGSWAGAPSAATQFPAKLNVDWVRVYQ
jgi:beta-glucanase (GH16 family)